MILFWDSIYDLTFTPGNPGMPSRASIPGKPFGTETKKRLLFSYGDLSIL